MEKNLGMHGLALIVDPRVVDKQTEDKQNNLVLMKAGTENPVSYWAGFAWDRAGKITSADAWKKYVDEIAQRDRSPIEVTVDKEQRAKSKGQRAKGKEQRAKSKEQRG